MSVYHEQGKYKVLIAGQQLGENKRGNPEVQLVIQPLGYFTRQGLEELATDFTRTIYLTLTPQTVGTEGKPGWVLETLRYLGFNGTSFAELDPRHPNHINLTGQEVEALCNHNTHQGKQREDWSILRPRNGAPIKELEKKGLRALDAKFGKVLKATAAKAAAREPTAAEAPADGAPAENDNDNIPF